MSEVKEYTNQLAQKLQETLGDNLIGLYQTGSSSLDDFQSSSDLDVIGVVSEEMKDGEKDTLMEILDHKNFPCPAKGLDLVIVTEQSVKNPVEEPYYDFRFSTGGSWEVETEIEGKAKEMLILFELCRRNGVCLFGEKPESLFDPVNRSHLIEALIDGLEWHQTEILDPFHDPYGQYSVLNACRALAFVRTDQFLSKTKGAEWFLENEPDNQLVRNALKIRKGQKKDCPDKQEIDAFLNRIIQELMIS